MVAWVLSGGNQDYGTNLRESFWSPGSGREMLGDSDSDVSIHIDMDGSDGVATEDSLRATGGHWHTDLLLSQ